MAAILYVREGGRYRAVLINGRGLGLEHTRAAPVVKAYAGDAYTGLDYQQGAAIVEYEPAWLCEARGDELRRVAAADNGAVIFRRCQYGWA